MPEKEVLTPKAIETQTLGELPDRLLPGVIIPFSDVSSAVIFTLSWCFFLLGLVRPASTTTPFGKLLRQFRKRAGLRQEDIASCLNVDVSRIKALESGKSDPPRDPAFYYRLRGVLGFSESDITRLLKATKYDPAWFAKITQREDAKNTPPQTSLHLEVIVMEDQHCAALLMISSDDGKAILGLRAGLPPTVAEAIQAEAPQIVKEEAERLQKGNIKVKVWSNEQAQDILTESFTDTSDSGIISSLMPPREVESGKQLPPPNVDTQPQGDPSAAQGTKAPERGIYQRRTQFDNEYLLAQRERLSQRFNAALQNPEDSTHNAAKQGLHVYAQSMAETEGMTLSQVAREHNISLATLSRLVRDKHIPLLYRDRQAIYLANETAQKLIGLNQVAKAEGKPLSTLVKAKRDELYPAEAVSQRRPRRERPARNQAEILVYEVVPTLSQAAEKSGVPPEEIVTTRDIQTEWNVSKGRVNRWTQGGPHGQPHLTPLPVRLGRERGSSQLLFRRSDVERLVADPPKGGRPREK